MASVSKTAVCPAISLKLVFTGFPRSSFPSQSPTRDCSFRNPAVAWLAAGNAGAQIHPRTTPNRITTRLVMAVFFRIPRSHKGPPSIVRVPLSQTLLHETGICKSSSATKRVGWIGAGATVTAGCAGENTSAIASDRLAEAVSQEGHKHQVHGVVPVVKAGIATSEDGGLMAEPLAQPAAVEAWAPCHCDARAEAAVVGVEGILGMAAYGADGLKAEDGIINLAFQRVAHRVLEILL